MQSQFVCGGCRTVLLYPSGARNVCCTICNMVTSVPPPEMEMGRLICGGCRTRLMHARGATTVRCSCCNTINLVPAAATPPNPNNIAHIKCDNCQTMLMYPAGALLVICTICQFTTNAMGHSHNQTVVIKNPWAIDESGRLDQQRKLESERDIRHAAAQRHKNILLFERIFDGIIGKLQQIRTIGQFIE